MIVNRQLHIKSDGKYITGINLIDMTHTNFVTDLT